MPNKNSATLKPNQTKAKPTQKEPTNTNKITKKMHEHHEQTKASTKAKPQNKTQIARPKITTKNRTKKIKIKKNTTPH